MADVKCACCGEPWDSYHIAHDTVPWMRKLFRDGAGCESCEGVVPEGVDPEEMAYEQARGIIMDSADDDPHQFASVNDLGLKTKRAEWRRPPDTVLWECDSCGVQICHDIDEGAYEVKPDRQFSSHWISGLYMRGGKFAQMYNHDDFAEEEILRLAINEADKWKPVVGAPEERCINGRPFCNYCAEECSACGYLTDSDEIQFDQNDHYHKNPTCLDCVEKIPSCSNCGSWLSDDEETDSEGNGSCCAEEKEEDAEEDDEA